MTHPLLAGSETLRDYLRALAGANVELRAVRSAIERQYVAEALRLHAGNVTHAARAVGVHRNTLARYVDNEKTKEAKG